MRSGVNIGRNLDTQERMLVYLKVASVALVSAKRYNPECDVALVSNLCEQEIPSEIRDIFSREAIKFFSIPFDKFRFKDNMPWALAFYKLCALEHIVNETNYQNLLYLDADVYVQGSLMSVWEEVKKNILLNDINHSLNVPDYIKFLDEVGKFYPDKQLITQWGGEFFASNKENAQIFIDNASKIFDVVKSSGLEITGGDELLISIAADNFRNIVKNAGGYVFRFWTVDFWLVSTCYRWNAVTVLHMPSEKERGLMKSYEKYIVKGKLPANKEVWKICRLSGSRYTGRSLKGKVKLFLKELLFTGRAIN